MDERNFGNTQPLISVIIPYFNTEKYLVRCVDSITAQTWRNLEIILVNDGSDDRSPSIARELASEDSRIVIMDVPHGGVSIARNAGLERASGKYVLFVDSDDWMAPRIIGHMARLMEKLDADLVTCEIERSEEISEFPSAKQAKYSVCTRDAFMRIFFKISSNEWVHFPVAKLYKRELLPKPLYPEHIRVGEDVLGTYLAVAETRKIVRLKEVGYYYFINPRSATSQFDERDFDLIRVWDKVVEATRGKEPDHSYARLNRDRINFTLLLRMLTELPARERKARFGKIEKQLRSDLKKCEKNLLHSPIVFSRKVLIFLLCHCYPVVELGGSILYKIGNRHGSSIAFSQRRGLS
ncbi:MAG: glycosyltransferase [Parasporobacterium sp.]|nr:glycosyltransferase [Parasporobacterium sp.]